MSTFGRLLLTFCDDQLRIQEIILRTLFRDLDIRQLHKTAQAIGVEIV